MRLLRQPWYKLPVLCALLFAGILAHADMWQGPASELAQKVASRLGGPATVSVTFKNTSTLTQSELQAVRADFDAQLRAHGYKVVQNSQSKASVEVTLSENAEGYVWLAQVTQASGQRADAVILSVPRVPTGDVTQGNLALVIRKRLLWMADEPILDVVIAPGSGENGAGTTATVLTRSRVTLHRVQSPQWLEIQSIPLGGTRPLPRDVRGVIVGRSDAPFEVRLAGLNCKINPAAGEKADCVGTDDPWPLTQGDSAVNAFFSFSRDFFTGALGTKAGGGASVPAFYTAAMLANSNWVFATTDGRVVESNLANTVTTSVSDWGSDLTQVRNSCGGEAVVLATRNGDYTRTDSVQGFQMVAREPAAVTAAVDFPGPVTALWSHGEWALAVVHNLSTGKYEAYSLSLFCNQ